MPRYRTHTGRKGTPVVLIEDDTLPEASAENLTGLTLAQLGLTMIALTTNPADPLDSSADGNWYTNAGAAGVVTVILETGSVGRRIGFLRHNATREFRIDPDAAGFIDESGTAMTVDKYVSIDSDGGLLEVMWNGAAWQILRSRGDRTLEA